MMLANKAGYRRVFAALWQGAIMASALSFSPLMSSAHETPIAVLALTEMERDVFAIDWKTFSTANAIRPNIRFPDNCLLRDQRLTCSAPGLEGKLSLRSQTQGFDAIVVQLNRLNSAVQAFTLTDTNPEIDLKPDRKLSIAEVAYAYIPLGFEHILLGIDHLLFVLCLVLLVRGTWMLCKTITAFTVAHSITLAAVTLEWVKLASAPVEAAIALSIVFVAAEVVRYRRGQIHLSTQFPWLVALIVGLLHGFGFAGALADIGLPEQNIPSALLFFNVGVELGQLSFVFIVLSVAWAFRCAKVPLPRWGAAGFVYLIGTLASYWFLARLTAIF